MPVVPLPDRPGWHRLVDADGIGLASFRRVEREGRVVADWFVLEAPVERATPVVLQELRGVRVAGPEALGRALVAGGGTAIRHAHVYRHRLSPRPQAPTTWALGPIEHGAAELAPAFLAAHPPGHIDYAMLKGEDTEAVLARMLNGGFGPLLDCSGVALRDGRVVGAIVCTCLDGEPWVLEVFREPAARGAGRALLQRALALCEGPTLGLAVTDGNPARGLYEALGFEHVHTAYSVDL